VVGADGTATLVWSEFGGVLKMVRIAPNGKYKTAVPVVDAPYAIATYPSIAMNKTGAGAIAWTEQHQFTSMVSLRVRRFNRRGVLAATTQDIATQSSGTIGASSVSLAGDGYITLAWSEAAYGQPKRVKVVRIDPSNNVAKTFTNLCRGDSGACQNPKVVTTEAGVSTLAWSEALKGEGPKVRTNQINAADLVAYNDADSLPLSKPLTTALDPDFGSYTNLELAGTPSGSAFASWVSTNSAIGQGLSWGVGARHISSAGVPSGTSADGVLSGPDSVAIASFAMSVSPAGDAVVAWVAGDRYGAHAKVTYRRISSNGNRAAASHVVDDSSNNTGVGVALSSTGAATLIWHNFVSNGVRQVVAPKNDVFVRSTVVSAATGTNNTGGPWVASGQDGTTFVNWLYTPAGTGKVRQFVTQTSSVAPTLKKLKFPSKFKHGQRSGQVTINSSKYGTAVVTIAPASKKLRFRPRVTRVALAPGGATVKFNTSGLLRGKYTVTVQLVDLAGLKATKSATLLVTS
jgi:hypothetical protein